MKINLLGITVLLLIVAFAYKGNDPDKEYVTHYSAPACNKTEDMGQRLFRQEHQNRQDSATARAVKCGCRLAALA